MLLRPFARLVIGTIAALLVVSGVKIEQTLEVAIFVGKFTLHLVSVLLFAEWAFAWILNGQGSEDDQCFAQATTFIGSKGNAGKARVNRHLCHVSTQTG